MNTSIEHMRLVNEISDYCETHDLTIFEHQYNYMVFGSWLMVIGKSKHRMKFNWDGKESYLGISVSEFQNSNSPANWEPVFPGVGGVQKSAADVFAFVKESLGKQYAI
jgi:hypothetical protein